MSGQRIYVRFVTTNQRCRGSLVIGIDVLYLEIGTGTRQPIVKGKRDRGREVLQGWGIILQNQQSAKFYPKISRLLRNRTGSRFHTPDGSFAISSIGQRRPGQGRVPDVARRTVCLDCNYILQL
jgi:hypothetical protein